MDTNKYTKIRRDPITGFNLLLSVRLRFGVVLRRAQSATITHRLFTGGIHDAIWQPVGSTARALIIWAKSSQILMNARDCHDPVAISRNRRY